ncbi:MAG: DUF5690 family protein [Bacteroidota bacterium]
MASPVRAWLSRSSPTAFTLYATVAAFCAYMCMYAFRKPFTAATFESGPHIWGLDYKSALVIIQVLGYMLSKFIGIKVVSEMNSNKRAGAILILIGIAELALLGFGSVSPPYNAIFLFFNGLPLGMIWGIVFSFLEGRKQTEVMGLGLCASFVFASGLVKDIGKYLMGIGISEYWMPFAVGGIFALPLLIFTWMLVQLPPPSPDDEEERTRRAPMNGRERWAYFQKLALGIVLLVAVYTILTAYRDFRDNFLADIWADLRGVNNTVNFSATETPVSIGVLLILMLIVLVKDNMKALMVNHLAVGVGVLLAGLSTWGHQQGWVGDYTWIILTGFGTYIAYIPFNSILFDRLIATFKHVGNVGFLIYVADSFGYMGSVGILLYKNFGAGDISWVNFFRQISYALAALGAIGIICSAIYFFWKKKSKPISLQVKAT